MSNIIVSIEGPVCLIKLNRPEKFNSVNHDLAYELQDQIDACEEDRSIKAVVITGEGRAFCAGQDIDEIVNNPDLKIAQILETYYNPIVRKIRMSRLPYICAVNGVAAGAGANLAFCCDIIICSEAASFVQAFSKIGLIPDSGGTWTLPRLVGYHKAFELMVTGEKLTAVNAEKIGLVNKVYSHETFLSESLKKAQQIATMPSKAIELTKKALQQSLYSDLSSHLEIEKEFQAVAGDSYDYREGINAFVEKRPPVFRGE